MDKKEIINWLFYFAIGLVVFKLLNIFGFVKTGKEKKEEKEASDLGMNKTVDVNGKKFVSNPFLGEKNSAMILDIWKSKIGRMPTYYERFGVDTLEQARAKFDRLAEEIWDAKGTFLDNEDVAVAAIKAANTHFGVSYLAHRFELLFKRNLLTFLNSFLEQKHMAEINSFLRKAKLY